MRSRIGPGTRQGREGMDLLLLGGVFVAGVLVGIASTLFLAAIVGGAR